MKKYKEFSNSSLNVEEEKSYLAKILNHHFSKEYKNKYSSILEEKHNVFRNQEKEQPAKKSKIIGLTKYALGAAACLLLFVLIRPAFDTNGDNVGDLVNKYATTDILLNKELKRGQALDNEFRSAAIQYYNDNNYQASLQSYGEIENLNDEDKFWMAMSSFYEKDYSSAENYFKDLTSIENLKFKSELNWYYALSLLKNGKVKEAKTLLSDMHSWKAEEAQQLLKALK